MASVRLGVHVGAGVGALGLGLLIVAGGGTAVASAAPGDSPDSPSKASSTEADHSTSQRQRTRKQAPSVSAATTRTIAATNVSAEPKAAVQGAAATPTVARARAATTSRTQATPRTAHVASPLLNPNPAQLPIATDIQSLLSALGGASREVAAPASVDPTQRAQYWIKQTSADCVLMATAMAIGQLTGKTPTEAQMVFDAMHTQSSVNTNQNIYPGLKTNSYTYYSDIAGLLSNWGISSTTKTYTPDEQDQALADLKAAVADPAKATVVSVLAQTIWQATVPGQENLPIPPGAPANHAVSVIGYDDTLGVVYINDSAWGYENGSATPVGQNLAVPLDTFLSAWASGGYRTVVAQDLGAAPTRTADWLSVAPRREYLNYLPSGIADNNKGNNASTWNFVQPRRDSNDPALGEHLVGTRNR